jgi:hypothetical protein
MSGKLVAVSTAFLLLAVAGRAKADTLSAAFATSYTITNIGSPSGVPAPLGGLTFLNNNTLLIGGNANNGASGIYEIGVTRDGAGNITGFNGSATLFATAPNIDGGLAYAPNGDLLFTEYPNNAAGELKPGSGTPDKTVNLSLAGVASSVGSLGFAPNGDLKILSYNGGGFYTCGLA